MKGSGAGRLGGSRGEKPTPRAEAAVRSARSKPPIPAAPPVPATRKAAAPSARKAEAPKATSSAAARVAPSKKIQTKAGAKGSLAASRAAASPSPAVAEAGAAKRSVAKAAVPATKGQASKSAAAKAAQRSGKAAKAAAPAKKDQASRSAAVAKAVAPAAKGRASKSAAAKAAQRSGKAAKAAAPAKKDQGSKPAAPVAKRPGRAAKAVAPAKKGLAAKSAAGAAAKRSVKVAKAEVVTAEKASAAAAKVAAPAKKGQAAKAARAAAPASRAAKAARPAAASKSAPLSKKASPKAAARAEVLAAPAAGAAAKSAKVASAAQGSATAQKAGAATLARRGGGAIPGAGGARARGAGVPTGGRAARAAEASEVGRELGGLEAEPGGRDTELAAHPASEATEKGSRSPKGAGADGANGSAAVELRARKRAGEEHDSAPVAGNQGENMTMEGSSGAPARVKQPGVVRIAAGERRKKGTLRAETPAEQVQAAAAHAHERNGAAILRRPAKVVELNPRLESSKGILPPVQVAPGAGRPMSVAERQRAEAEEMFRRIAPKLVTEAPPPETAQGAQTTYEVRINEQDSLTTALRLSGSRDQALSAARELADRYRLPPDPVLLLKVVELEDLRLTKLALDELIEAHGRGKVRSSDELIGTIRRIPRGDRETEELKELFLEKLGVRLA